MGPPPGTRVRIVRLIFQRCQKSRVSTMESCLTKPILNPETDFKHETEHARRFARFLVLTKHFWRFSRIPASGCPGVRVSVSSVRLGRARNKRTRRGVFHASRSSRARTVNNDAKAENQPSQENTLARSSHSRGTAQRRTRGTRGRKNVVQSRVFFLCVVGRRRRRRPIVGELGTIAGSSLRRRGIRARAEDGEKTARWRRRRSNGGASDRDWWCRLERWDRRGGGGS